jgi:hypothetical protein
MSVSDINAFFRKVANGTNPAFFFILCISGGVNLSTTGSLHFSVGDLGCLQGVLSLTGAVLSVSVNFSFIDDRSFLLGIGVN